MKISEDALNDFKHNREVLADWIGKYTGGDLAVMLFIFAILFKLENSYSSPGQTERIFIKIISILYRNRP